MAAEGLNELRDKALNLKNDISSIVGGPWPQTKINPEFSKTKGFLPPQLIKPSVNLLGDAGVSIPITVGNYVYEDWLGQKITTEGLIQLDKKDRFSESLNIPKTKDELSNSPYSLRDHYLLFGDSSTDYFKHGLQIIDNLNPIEDDGSDPKLRASQFKNTPFENNDPVMFGFELIIDDISSPLLNGSVLDFLNNYSMVSEIEVRKKVYDDFKNQFIKFFKTKTSQTFNSINNENTSITRTTSPNSQIGKSRSIYQNGNRAYMSYYIQSIGGLKGLIEKNKPGAFESFVDYRKDTITLDFLEDVSLSVGTLTHLYKLLYWSKPNGKNIVPENLLRFNCNIVVSETRNFNRVRRAVEDGNLEIIKDNVSRYIYTLYDCQFFFNELMHDDKIDMGAIKELNKVSLQFDYKYASVKFERFVPTSNGLGQYVGYDGGSLWKIGNPGVRNGTQSVNYDISIPTFHTVGKNTLRQNGVESPLVFKTIIHNSNTTIDDPNSEIKIEEEENLNDLEKNSKKSAKDIAKSIKNKTIQNATRELQTAINVRTQLLARTINKTLISLQGGTISPPKNIYTDAQPGSVGNFTNRFFYDVRGELVGFLGDSLGSAITGAGGGLGISAGFSN